MPTEMDEINRRIIALQIEEVSLKKETDDLSKSRLTKIQKELASCREKYDEMSAKLKTKKRLLIELIF